MKLFSLFSRPAWENADAGKRAHAVASANDVALLERLPEIARHDADAKVRLAAVRRIDDLSLLGDRARLDLAPEVRDAAGLRLRQRLLDPSVAVEARIRIVRVVENEPLLELIACEAPEVDLRACALERVRRTSFLVERCTRESDASLRLVLLERIEDPAHLERISERARKTDKQLSRVARERVQAMRLAAGDPAAVEARAVELCADLDALMRARSADAAQRMVDIERHWSALPIAADAPVSRRYRGLADTLGHMLNPPAKVEPEAVEVPIDIPAEAPVPEAEPAPVVEADPAEVAARMQLDAEIAARREAEQVRRRELRERIQREVATYAAALDAGKFNDARTARNALAAIDAEWSKSHWDEAKRLAELEIHYAKLERWQQWSAREAQKRLCETAETLIGSGLHPDALMTRVRELQGEWERATANEPASANDALSRRFRAIIAQSIAPARPYLEKRKELRDEKSRALHELLDGADASLADEALPLTALLEWRTRLNEAGALVAELVGSDRRDAGQRRKQLADAVHARIEAFNAGASEAKQQLLARLRRQLASADPREQVNIAKSAMPQWKTLPRGQRKTEDALWNEFRALIDPVFERDRELLTQARSERESQLDAVTTLLAELDALADSETDAEGMRHQAQQLRQRFQTLEGRDREHELAFDRTQARISRRIDAARAEHVRQQRARAQTLATNVARFEREAVAGVASDALATLLQTLDLGDAPGELSRRIAAARAASEQPDLLTALSEELADSDAAGQLALSLELLAGLPSPDEFREQRRELQMARLAEKLSGGATKPAADEALMLWREWLDLTGTGDASRSTFDARVALAVEKLLDGK